MLPEVGPCRGTIPRWTFDPTTQTCKTFLYGGCQGNGNNFASSAECSQVCGGTPVTVSSRIVAPPKTTTAANNDMCMTGKAMAPVIFRGVSNDTVEACSEQSGCPLTHSCVASSAPIQVTCCPKTADDCFLPVTSGQCKASLRRFHFNPKTKTCDQFVYSGCGANGNNFATFDQCKQLCPGKV